MISGGAARTLLMASLLLEPCLLNYPQTVMLWKTHGPKSLPRLSSNPPSH